MSKNYAIIIHFMLPLTTFYRSGAHRSDVYKWDAFVTSWRFYNRAWQPQRHDRLSETSGTLWIHRGALTNQRCSLATGCGIKQGSLPDALSLYAITIALHHFGNDINSSARRQLCLEMATSFGLRLPKMEMWYARGTKYIDNIVTVWTMNT